MTNQRVSCKNCDHVFQVDEDESGGRKRCPECNTVLDLPDFASEGKGTELDSSRNWSRLTGHDGFPEFSVHRVIRTSLRICYEEFTSFMLLSLLFMSPLILAAVVLLSMPGNPNPEGLTETWTMISAVGGLILTPLLSAAVTYGVVRKLNDEAFVVSDCVSDALSMLIPLVALVFVKALFIGTFLLLSTSPNILIRNLFIFSGFLVWLLLFVCIPVLVIEQTGIFEAMRRSYELTSGHLLGLLGVVLCLVLICFVIMLMLSTVLVMVNVQPETLQSARMKIIFSCLFAVLLNAIIAVTIATTYFYLRMDQEETSLDDMAQVIH